MKLPFSFILLFSAVLTGSCKKDLPTLNEKIEGSWRIPYYQIATSANPEYIKNGLAFESEDVNKGIIWWAEHRDLDGTKDTITGSYTLDENAGTIQIKWKDVLYPYGMTKDGIYDINLAADSLTLKRIDPIYKTILVKAVRN